MEGKKRKSAASLKSEMPVESTAMSLLDGIFDKGTFCQLGAYVKKVSTKADTGEKASDFEGVITGYGAVDGRLVFAYVQDGSRMKGAFGEYGAKKVCMLYETAVKAGAPVVAVFDSCGAKVEEGASALAAYAKVMNKTASAGGYIPQIAVVSGVCAGSMAAVAQMCDVVIASDKSELYVSSPFVTKANTTPLALAGKGEIDIVCGEAELAGKVREVLVYLPSNSEAPAMAENDDDLNRLTPETEELVKSGDMYGVIKSVADNGKFTELSAGYAPEMITALTTIGGYGCGIVASNPKIKNGAITPDAAKKAAGLINLCGDYGMPVVTLVDSVGAEASAENESSCYASAVAGLAYAYAQAPTAMVTAVLGKAYGLAGTVMGTRSVGADVVYATESSEISTMAPEAAVTFLYGKEIADSEAPEKARKEKLDEWKSEHCDPAEAARIGEVDDIVGFEELRQRICAAIEMMNANI